MLIVLRSRDILLIASGGGHTGYIVAVSEWLRHFDNHIGIDAVIPCGDLWSYKLVKGRVDNVFCVRKPRYPGEKFRRAILGFPLALYESVKRIGGFTYKLAIAGGSNHSIAPSLVTRLRGSRIYVIESHDRFVTHGKATFLLYKIGARPVLHWPEQKMLYPDGLVFGPIVRRRKYNVTDEGYVLVVGGFEGNKRLYDVLLRTDLKNVVLQTGRIDPSIYKSQRPEWIVFDFDPDIDKWIAGASVVIGHNSVTLLEAAVTYGKPAIVLWNPEWGAAATRDDVKLFTKRINGVFLDDLNVSNLLKALEKARKNKPPRYHNGALIFSKYILEILYRMK